MQLASLSIELFQVLFEAQERVVLEEFLSTFQKILDTADQRATQLEAERSRGSVQQQQQQQEQGQQQQGRSQHQSTLPMCHQATQQQSTPVGQEPMDFKPCHSLIPTAQGVDGNS